MQDPAEWHLTSPGGVKHKLLEQRGRFGREDAAWTMIICIQAVDLVAFLSECFPEPTVVGPLVLYPRRFYPAGLPSLECKDIEVEGFTSGRPIDPFVAGALFYDPDEYAATMEPYLRVTLNFGTSSANDQARDAADPFTFLEIAASGSGEFLSSEVNQDDVAWKDETAASEPPGPKDVDLHRTVRSMEIEWTLKWPQVPYVFFYNVLKARLHAAMGKVNDAAMTLFGSAPAETILFLNYQTTEEYTWRNGFTGASPVALTMHFLEKNFQGKQKRVDGTDVSVQVTHNHVWRTGRGWMRLEIDGQPPYEQYDLMKIFTG